MQQSIANESPDSGEDLRRLKLAIDGDPNAFAELLEKFRERLKLLVSVRIDPRVTQRLDASDVLQELFVRLLQDQKRLSSGEANPIDGPKPLNQGIGSAYLWLRKLAIWTLGDLQRKHLGVQQRDPRREVNLVDRLDGGASSLEIMQLLTGSVTQPLDAMVSDERMQALQTALDHLEPIDREILMLRHGEQLSRSETAQVLNISIAAAAKRYTRALERVRIVMKEWNS